MLPCPHSLRLSPFPRYVYLKLVGALTGTVNVSAGTTVELGSVASGGQGVIKAAGGITINGSYSGTGVSMTDTGGNITVKGGIFRDTSESETLFLSAENGVILIGESAAQASDIGTESCYVGSTTLSLGSGVTVVLDAATVSMLDTYGDSAGITLVDSIDNELSLSGVTLCDSAGNEITDHVLYTQTYTEEGGKKVTRLMVTPEPATVTLSLLALGALAARRRLR